HRRRSLQDPVPRAGPRPRRANVDPRGCDLRGSPLFREQGIMSDLRVGAGLVLPEAELDWTAVRSGGPGGQNVNKVATKVELRFDAASSSVLSDAVRARLLRLARGRLDADGRIVITCDETRSQRRNLELARERLAALVGRALVAPKPRRK